MSAEGSAGGVMVRSSTMTPAARSAAHARAMRSALSPSAQAGSVTTRRPRGSECTAAPSSPASTLEGSPALAPLIAASTVAVSATHRAIGPILSQDQHSAMQPSRDTRPKVGLSPVVPQRSQGETIDPSVSVPIANGTHPAATAEALPALDPDEP